MRHGDGSSKAGLAAATISQARRELLQQYTKDKQAKSHSARPNWRSFIATNYKVDLSTLSPGKSAAYVQAAKQFHHFAIDPAAKNFAYDYSRRTPEELAVERHNNYFILKNEEGLKRRRSYNRDAIEEANGRRGSSGGLPSGAALLGASGRPRSASASRPASARAPAAAGTSRPPTAGSSQNRAHSAPRSQRTTAAGAPTPRQRRTRPAFATLGGVEPQNACIVNTYHQELVGAIPLMTRTMRGEYYGGAGSSRRNTATNWLTVNRRNVHVASDIAAVAREATQAPVCRRPIVCRRSGDLVAQAVREHKESIVNRA